MEDTPIANRDFHKRQSLEKECKDLYARVTIAGSGAPTLVASASLGVASISRTSAGLYVLTLQDKYASLKYFDGAVIHSTAEDLNFQVSAESVVSAKTITFRTLAGGVATDPASGDILLLKIEVKNTTVL